MKLVTDSDFESMVLKAEKPVVVDFFTDSCRPCKMLAPVLEQLDQELDCADIVKLDAGGSATADSFGITSVPTLILFKDGAEVDRIEGLYPKPAIEAWITNNTADMQDT
jgi:thioredoxin 1